ncbi:MAG: hypothetical protein ACHQUC_02755 [Chlamydiales bacterium]
MKRVIYPALAFISFILPGCLTVLSALPNDKPAESVLLPSTASAESNFQKSFFEPFTGKITKNKVRLRLQPNYDGQVIQELNQGDMYIALGDAEDFYAIKPPSEFKAYVFRTFVLDNVIEGNRVNVRLKPDLDAPVIAQLNSGDRVDGIVDPAHPKWLEIKMPESARFYIAKEFVEKIGDANYLARLEKRRQDVNHLLTTNEVLSQSEMERPFNQINIEGIKASYQRIIADYSDFPEATTRAKEALASLQNRYANKKMAYLETQSRQTVSQMESSNQKLNQELQAHKSKIANLEQQMEQSKQAVAFQSANEPSSPSVKPSSLPINMSIWIPLEDGLFAAWSQQTGNSDPHLFYQEQMQNAFLLKGIVDPYNRPVKNKPGDYMLMNSLSKLPIAFLYSTQVNLQDYVGHEVSIRVYPRPNNHYAFPAYFVLSVDTNP